MKDLENRAHRCQGMTLGITRRKRIHNSSKHNTKNRYKRETNSNVGEYERLPGPVERELLLNGSRVFV